jgi:hypothetical protein
MSGASTGLHKALARAGSSVIAIAEMQADDLLAELSDEQKTALATALTPSSNAGAPGNPPAADASAGDEPGDGEPDEKKDEKAKKKEGMEASAAANTSERDRVKAVAKAVAEDDTCKGKADLALAMLADDDFAGLNATAMVKLIGKQSASAGDGDPEAAARSEMQNAIRSSSNSGVDASGGGKPGGKAEQSASVWDAAIAKVAPNTAK